uniref:Uncharacterized protein n=1 Tax=Anguilla anguilla TaxID=7936 RepID=A0A0E9U569_ANGAN
MILLQLKIEFQNVSDKYFFCQKIFLTPLYHHQPSPFSFLNNVLL